MNFNHYFQLNKKFWVKEINYNSDTFIGTSANKNTFTTTKYSFATVLINKCFAIKNKCNTTCFRCKYCKNLLFTALRAAFC